MKIVKPRHRFFFSFYRPLVRIFIRLVYGYKSKDFYKVPKGQGVLILSNHQTDWDPFFVGVAFNTPMHYIATDTFFSKNRLLIAWLQYSFYLIPKKKGASDLEAVKKMLTVAKEHGSICLFAEGNRTYADNQFYIGVETAKLIKALKIPVVFYNIHGGFGVMPRFFHTVRKGKLYGEVRKVMNYEEYKNIPDEELLKIVKENLRVSDVDLNEKYKSNKRAEYLERMLFVCPKCGKIETLESHGNFIKCNNCGLEVEYTENLLLKSQDKDFKFNRLIEWYDFQKEYVKNIDIVDGKTIFKDPYAKLFKLTDRRKRKLLTKGNVELTNKKFKVGDIEFNVEDITSASPVMNKKITFRVGDNNYYLVGHEKFNPLKYVLAFNKLDTYMHVHGLDNYYKLD